jgi:membrane-bound inhibitor of C-type lysozyme
MRFVALFAVLTLAACQTPCPATNPETTHLSYRCDDGSQLDATFSHLPDSAHVVQEGYAPVDLPSRITGSGYRYAQEGAELRGHGPDVRWERPGAAETICHEIQPGRAS